MRKAWVYKIVSPSGKIYIGSTVNIKSRWYHYKSLNCKKQRRLYFSLKKYGPEKHSFEIVAECNTDNILQQESYYGILYEVLGKNGLNCNIPKHGEKYISVCPETREKQSAISIGNKNMLGKVHSEASKKKMSIAAKGRKMSEKTKALLSAANKGKPKNYTLKHTDEAKRKISIAGKARKLSDIHKERIGKAHKGKVIPEAAREWLRIINTGKKCSPETKEKMRISAIKAKAKNKICATI